MIPVSDLTKIEQPYRTIETAAFEELKQSITGDFDFFKRRPCLVNRRNGQLIVYAGNHKLDAAIALGWKEVPCIIHEISEEEEKLRMLKDNVHAGTFDMEFIEMAYERDFLANEVGFDVTLLNDPTTFERPDEIVQPIQIDTKLYAIFNAEKLWVDPESDEWLQQEIKAYGDRMTTVFNFMSHLRKQYQAALDNGQ